MAGKQPLGVALLRRNSGLEFLVTTGMPRATGMPRRRVMQPLATLALAGVAMHALVDFPFQIESIQLYVATYLGVCWGSSLWYDKSEVRRHSSEAVVGTEHC